MNKPNFRFIFLVCFFSISTSALYAQNTFEFTLKDTLRDQYISDAIELSTGGWILLSNEVYTGNPRKAQLLRVSSSGQIIGTREIGIQGKSVGFIKIIELNLNLFLLAGYQETNDSSYLYLYKIDSLFNDVQNKILPLGNYFLYTVSDLIVNGNNITCSGNFKTGVLKYAFIYKFSFSLDSLLLRVFIEHLTQLPPDVLIKPGNTGYYYFIGAFGPPANINIIDLDSAFNIKKIVGVPKDLRHSVEGKWISCKSYVLAGNRDFSSSYRCTGVICIDTLTQLLHEKYFGVPDTIEWPGLRSRLDFLDTNKIYVGGTHNFCMYSEFCPVHCWFSLNQMDTTLSVNWQYFYGGDANYTMYGIRATKDKGCLMFGSRYDLNASNLERDIYVIKVNEDGLVFPTGIESPRMYNAIVYPNPGSDHLIIESGEQITGAMFRMFSMEGKEVICHPLWDRKFRIDTKYLTPGTYVWEISHKGKQTESGKWIKANL